MASGRAAPTPDLLDTVIIDLNTSTPQNIQNLTYGGRKNIQEQNTYEFRFG